MPHEEALHYTIADVLAMPATATLPTDDAIEELAADHNAEEDDGITLRNSKIRTRYYLVRALVWYLEHYKNDPCETVILPSGKPAVELSFRVPLPIEVGGVSLLLCGHIDRAVRFNDYLYVSDYKTTKSLTQATLPDVRPQPPDDWLRTRRENYPQGRNPKAS